jgi:hypothetical protein
MLQTTITELDHRSIELTDHTHVAGAGNVATADGLRASAKALEHPPEPNAARQSSTLLSGGVGSHTGLRAM